VEMVYSSAFLEVVNAGMNCVQEVLAKLSKILLKGLEGHLVVRHDESGMGPWMFFKNL